MIYIKLTLDSLTVTSTGTLSYDKPLSDQIVFLTHKENGVDFIAHTRIGNMRYVYYNLERGEADYNDEYMTLYFPSSAMIPEVEGKLSLSVELYNRDLDETIGTTPCIELEISDCRIDDAVYPIDELPHSFPIGYAGEKNYRTMTVDAYEWLSKYPDCEIVALVRRPDEEDAFPVAVERDDTDIILTADEWMMRYNGTGELQFQLMDGDRVIGKSAIVRLLISNGLMVGTTPPNDPDPSWLDRMEQKSYMESLRVERVAQYLYNAHFSNLDYADGIEFFDRFRPAIGGCSVAAKGNLIGRNYDWYYDEMCSFIAHTPAELGRHAVIGVCKGTENLTNDFIESKQYSRDYRIAPFRLLDGINDAGVFCEINVCPAGDKGYTTGTHPEYEGLPAPMIPRYVLDYASNVDEAISLLEHRNIYSIERDGEKQEFHFIISDPERTVCIEFLENTMAIVENFVNDRPIMTNFYLSGYNGTRKTLTPYAAGIERYAILADGFDAVESEQDMFDLMQNVIYTKAYSPNENPIWYSEFCGNYREFGDLTKDSPPEDYAGILAYARSLFADRQRDGKTWQTVHTSIYNVSQRKLIVSPQESGKQYTFRLDMDGVCYQQA